MVNFGGARSIPHILKHLKSGKTHKFIKKNNGFSKKTLKSKSILGLTTNNLKRMLGSNKTQRRINNLKVTYEQTANIENKIIITTNKFIKLFNNILHNEQKYIEARIQIESMLEALDALKGDPIERHHINNVKFKSKLEKKISEDDKIRTYRNLLKTAKDIYENSNNNEQRLDASLFLSSIIDELYDEFFSSKKINRTMNINLENQNNNIDDLLNMFKKTGI